MKIQYREKQPNQLKGAVIRSTERGELGIM